MREKTECALNFIREKVGKICGKNSAFSEQLPRIQKAWFVSGQSIFSIKKTRTPKWEKQISFLS